MRRFWAAVCSMAVLGAAGAAKASVVTFTNLAAPDSYSAPNYQTLSSGGLLFEGVGVVGAAGAGIVGQDAANNADPGGATLYNPSGSQLVITGPTSLDRFDLVSLQMADLANTGSSGVVEFDIYRDGSFFGKRFVTLDATPGLQTVDFNLTHVSQLAIAGRYPDSFNLVFQIDNIVLSGTTAAVPEPSAWALALIGFGAAGAALRRRRAQIA